MGLTQLATVGDDWLAHCTSLTAVDCTGLTQLSTQLTYNRWQRLACLSHTACRGRWQLASRLYRFDDAGLHRSYAACHGGRRLAPWLHPFDAAVLVSRRLIAQVLHGLYLSATLGLPAAPV